MADIPETVEIHDSTWERSHVEESIAYCKESSWERKVWFPRDALVHRSGGTVSFYVGQKFDPAKIDLVKGGWSHDHCQICWWDLYESEDPEHGIGYTNGDNWLCSECYSKFIASEVSADSGGI
jgi:hypothetical protein